jgi:hypothetical protein
MATGDLEAEKDAIIDRITVAYSKGEMELAAFELAVARISGCADGAALAAEASKLGLDLRARTVPLPAEELIELGCRSGSIKKSGTWVSARHYRITVVSSWVVLDFSAYEGSSGMRVEIEPIATSSQIKLILPRGFRVEDRVAHRTSSSIRCDGFDEGDNLVIVSGSLVSSTVKARSAEEERERRAFWARVKARLLGPFRRRSLPGA